MALECVTFDLDDTLFLERDYVRSGVQAVGAWVRTHLGAEGFAEHAWRAFTAGVRGQIFDVSLADCGVESTPALIETLVTIYREHSPAINVLDDARSCLDRLRRQAVLAVVTDGPLSSQRAKAEALGVGEWALCTVFTAELGDGFGKPHPLAFEIVQQTAGVAGRVCAYIADNPLKDFAAPRSLGWATVRVRRAGSLHEDVPSGADVDVEVADLWEGPNALGLPG